MVRKRRKFTKEKAVGQAIIILEDEVGPKYGAAKKHLLGKHKIHLNHTNKYNKMFVRIIEYLEDLCGSNKNSLNSLLRDYYTSVFEHFQRFKRQPTLMNFSPSPNNQINFQEWIIRYEKDHDERYWLTEIPPLEIHYVKEEFKSELGFVEV